jgi:two-component system OmpR family sensor kinase
MFRSLATRLTATYVFGAIVLTLAVVAAVIAFMLSTFGIASQEEMDAVARETPLEAKLQIARAGSLRAAAAQIVENLGRPGLRVGIGSVSADNKRIIPLAVAVSDPTLGGKIVVIHFSTFMRGIGFPNGPGGPPPGGIGPEASGPGPFHDGDPRPDGPLFDARGRGPQYPAGFDPFVHVAPRNVSIPGGRVRVMADPSSLDRTIHDFVLAMIPIGLLAVGAAGLIGRFITNQALRPLVETTASLRRFGTGDFTPRAVTTTDRNEIGELVNAYNAAAAQVASAFEERRQAEANMRRFIADAGHELRTPLTVIMGFIDVLRRRAQHDAQPAGDGASNKIYDTMLAESRRMKALIEKLIVLARLENIRERDLETVDLGAVAGAVVSALQVLEARPRLALRTEPDAIVRGYESELHDAVSNLVENALKYAPDSPVEVGVRVESGDVVVDVRDRGPGIPSDEQEQVFTRFFRGRDHGDAEGFGLGLAIAKRAAERSNGSIALASAPGEGTAFTIRIPQARGEAVAAAV